MRMFSWHTDEKPCISTYLNGALKKRYLVVDGIDVIGRAVMHYKPKRKGGHTHNHVFNAVNRHTFRKKKQRLKAKNRKFLFDRSPKETLEDSSNHWAIFKEIFYNKV